MANNPNHVRMLEKQPHRAKIFLSCGQASKEECDYATKIQKKLQEKLNFDVYVAKTVSTINALNIEILENLKNSDYFLCINFPRELVSDQRTKKCFFRGSLYTNQEIAMAIAVGFTSDEMLILSHKDVERDGLLKIIVTNDCDFSDQKIVDLVIAKIKESHWNSQYSRSIKFVDVQFNPKVQSWRAISQKTKQRRRDWLAWVDVKNCRKDFVATNCMLHLKRIFDNEGKELPNDEPYPLKCCWVDGYSHTIFPGDTVRFDLLAIEENTFNVFLRSNADYRPNNEFIFSGKGIYKLEYELCADMFPLKSFWVELAVGMDFLE